MRERCVNLVRWGLLIAVLVVAATVPALAEDKLEETFTKGKVHFNLRYRYEFVDQDDFAQNANANTIRLRLGYTTKAYHGFFGTGEYQGNWGLGSERYNSTQNSHTQYPVVIDPQDSDFSRLLVGYTLFEQTVFKAGRQWINLDNQRFIGTVAWRQLEQSFDAFSINSKQFENLALFYSYLGNVNRVFGENNPNPALADADQDSHLLNIAWSHDVGTLVGYAYLLDFQENPMASNQTFGLRFTGSSDFDSWKLLYGLEYADQSDYADGAATIDADYFFAEIGGAFEWITVKLGYEALGGDSIYAFQTPFATLHKFNGWADQFVITPVDGLGDVYIALSDKIGKWNWQVAYHDFSADTGGDDYGSEIDLAMVRGLSKHCQVGVKYAQYDADTYNFDTKKFWVWFQVKL